MTFTATGVLNPVRVIFDAVFQPTTVADTRETGAAHFRIAIRREKERVHLVERLVFKPTRGRRFGVRPCWRQCTTDALTPTRPTRFCRS
jgi:hypothetical protein